MATLPSVPSFITGETPSIAKLNQLAYCVTFLNTIPAFGQFTDINQSVATSTNTALSWTKVTDRDGGWAAGNPTRYTAQTGGYYTFCGIVGFAGGSGAFSGWYQVTTGSNNPGGSGHTQAFGFTDAGGTAGSNSFSLGELSPYLYVLDYVELFVSQTSGSSQFVNAYMQVTLESLGP